MTEESVQGLTVREVAALSGLHAQTVRKYIRDGELPATKTQGTHGPEWRIPREEAEALRRAQEDDSTQSEADLRRTLSSLTAVADRLRRIEEGQLALAPSPEEARARADREARLAAALEAAPEVARLAEALGEARARADRAEAEAARLREDLAERRQSWWRRLFGAARGSGGR